MKLNLGCGNDKRESTAREKWINCDIREEVNPDKVCDVRELPFEDSSVSEIIAQDILEHFEHPVKVLKEMNRVLEKGGEIYIRVPDFERLQDERHWKNIPFENLENQVLGGRKNKYDQHKSLFTKNILRERLKKAGFHNIIIKRNQSPPLHWMILAHAVK